MTNTTAERPSFREWLKAKQPPNNRRLWTAEEIQRLDDEVGLYGMSWERIAELHGRSVAAVQQKARGPRSAT